MPVEVRCSKCGHVFWYGDFDDVSNKADFSFRDIAWAIVETIHKCPKCGKVLTIPKTVEVEPVINQQPINRRRKWRNLLNKAIERFGRKVST